MVHRPVARRLSSSRRIYGCCGNLQKISGAKLMSESGSARAGEKQSISTDGFQRSSIGNQHGRAFESDEMFTSEVAQGPGNRFSYGPDTHVKSPFRGCAVLRETKGVIGGPGGADAGLQCLSAENPSDIGSVSREQANPASRRQRVQCLP